MEAVSLYWVVLGTLAASAPCDAHQLSHSSVSSLLELAGFAAPCVSRALAQCHDDSNPLATNSTVSTDIHNLTENIHRLADIIQGLQNTSQPTPQAQELPRPRNCQDLKESGDSGRGVRRIFPFSCCPDRRVSVFCDQLTDGGGWTVIQRRGDFPPPLDFFRTWVEYQKGFGDLTQEFWLGLDNIHQLTSESLQEIRVELADFDNETRWAKYDYFHVGDLQSNYTMHCGTFSGNAGNNLGWHNGMQFTTKDMDNDLHLTANCAVSHVGAWWYNACHGSNLNGKYLRGENEDYADGVIWNDFRGHYYSLRSSEMKVRPAFPRMQ